MNELQADLESLRRLSKKLHGHADDAARLRATNSISVGNSTMSSVAEAVDISANLLDITFVSAIRERLSETGEVMSNVADQYSHEDAATAADLAKTYTDATGAWEA